MSRNLRFDNTNTLHNLTSDYMNITQVTQVKFDNMNLPSCSHNLRLDSRILLHGPNHLKFHNMNLLHSPPNVIYDNIFSIRLSHCLTSDILLKHFSLTLCVLVFDIWLFCIDSLNRLFQLLDVSCFESVLSCCLTFDNLNPLFKDFFNIW